MDTCLKTREAIIWLVKLIMEIRSLLGLRRLVAVVDCLSRPLLRHCSLPILIYAQGATYGQNVEVYSGATTGHSLNKMNKLPKRTFSFAPHLAKLSVIIFAFFSSSTLAKVCVIIV
jgi:hypothetical protein